MIHNEKQFRDAIRHLVQADDGLSIESEGTVYIRSLEGGQFAAGLLDNEGAIEAESLFNDNIDAAIDHFIKERARRNHGSEW